MEEPKLLALLKRKADEYISGEEIARGMGLSRAAIWKEVELLRGLGYRIEAKPRCGYRLEESPDKLYPWEIQEGLTTRFVGHNIIYFDQTDSTNNQAKEVLKKAPPDGTLVLAETQSAGRGRLGRAWFSPVTGGLWMTLILKPTLPVADIPKLTMMAAVALRKAIMQVTGVEALIKWPNDLLQNGRKICGILAELSGEADRLTHLIIGIGLNVNQVEEDFPEELRSIGTSLRIALGRKIRRRVLLQGILDQLEKEYLKVSDAGFQGVLEDCRRYSATLGANVIVSDGNRRLMGVAEEIEDNGGLRLLLPSGERVMVYSGDTTIKK